MTLSINEHNMLVSDGAAIEFRPTRNVSEGYMTPKFIVLQTYPHQTLSAIWVDEEDWKRSTHLDIDNNGRLYQRASFIERVWHAGHSFHQGYYGLNNCSIGIGLTTELWSHTGVQLGELYEVLRALVHRYNIRDIVQLSDVAPGIPSNSDFPFERFRGLTKLGNSNSGGRYVITHDIDVYAGPSPDFEIINRLHRGDGVSLLRNQGDWALVSFQQAEQEFVMGWVHDTFIKRV
jgi:hypothetical protein